MYPFDVDATFEESIRPLDRHKIFYIEKMKKHNEYYRLLHGATAYRCSPVVRDEDGNRKLICTFFSASHAAGYIQRHSWGLTEAHYANMKALKLSSAVSELGMLIREKALKGLETESKRASAKKPKYKVLTNHVKSKYTPKATGRPRGRPRKEVADRPFDETDRIDYEAEMQLSGSEDGLE